jgi:hypothetical protein
VHMARSKRGGPRPKKLPRPEHKLWLQTLGDLDLRTKAASHAIALRDNLVSDLGGRDNVTVAEMELCTRAAVLGSMCQHYETGWLSGDTTVDLARYFNAATIQRRVLADVGLQRRAKDITPLADYLKQKKQLAETATTVEADPPGEPSLGTPSEVPVTDIETPPLSHPDRGAPQHSQNSENEDSAE